jgi:hypothetical protein
MKRHAYLLILLLLSAQVDDAWAVAPVLSSAQSADDDNEYLPSERRTQGEESCARQEPICVGLKPHTADFSFVPWDVPSEWNLNTPFAPPPLYAFMSLQI